MFKDESDCSGGSRLKQLFDPAVNSDRSVLIAVEVIFLSDRQKNQSKGPHHIHCTVNRGDGESDKMTHSVYRVVTQGLPCRNP